MPRSISEINAEHLDRLRAWYDAAPSKLSRSSVSYRAILAHYYNLLISPDSSVLEVGCGSGELLGRLRAKRKVGIDLSERQIEAARERSPDCEFQVQAAETLELGAHESPALLIAQVSTAFWGTSNCIQLQLDHKIQYNGLVPRSISAYRWRQAPGEINEHQGAR